MYGQNPNSGQNPLFTRLDVDPGRWRPLFYGVEISVPVAAGGIGRGSITLNAQPYILKRLHGKIVGDTAIPTVSGLYQDGQWDVEFTDEQSNYQSGPIPGDLLFGGINAHYFFDLPIPIPFAGNKTLVFRVTNRVTRVLVPEADFFQVSIAAHGISDWGTAAESRS